MKKQFKSVFIVILFVLWTALSSTLPGAVELQSSYSEAIKEFEKFVEEQMALDKAPGLSVGFNKGDFIWTKGFGFSNLENKVPAKPENSYRLASITKTITAIAVLQLVEAGKIDLDAEVQTYVPYFPKKKWPVTVRLLLGHIGGISHYKNYDVEGHIKVHKNTKEALAIFQDFDLVAEPGTKYNYSSYGFNLLGAVIEEASGQSYGAYIKKHIFDPLGMENSRMDDPEDLISNRVSGYRLIKGEVKNSEFVNVSSRFAGGGTRSTVVDLLRYTKGIIEGKLLKRQTWKLVFTSMATHEGRFTGYGMGWGVRPWQGHFRVSHGGSQPETRTHLLIFPEENFSIAVASNLERLNLTPYVRRLAELVLEEDLDSLAYVSDTAEQVIYDNCAQVFSYGMSSLDWHGTHISNDETELAKAFSYFNKYVDKKSLKKDFKETKKKIEEGLHPASKQALIKVGSFMAYALKESLGEKKLQIYYQSGPLAFFSDYIKISKNWPSTRKNYKFPKSFTKLISGWEKDWTVTYTDYVRNLLITVNTDFDELGSKLKRTFSGVDLYPDFSRDMERAGYYYLWKDEIQNSLKIFNLNRELYPNSPLPLSNLAATYIWTGNVEEAQKLFKKAFALNPDHPRVSLNEFRYLRRHLENAKKLKEIFALAEIALELYPKNAELHKEVADIYLEAGQNEKAGIFYKKALELDPKLEEAKRKLEELEKEKKKLT
ncbi:MAG: serine hydrolase [Candidatus Aminicenantes bacterium]|nr:serine hydrolase [Candidatus Aminicenantes bacterium]